MIIIKNIKKLQLKKILRGDKLSLFLDFDKNEQIFYSNLYLDDYKLVVKVPITNNRDVKKETKIDKFDLVRYTYLCAVK